MEIQNLKEITASFQKQAAGFESELLNFSKEEYLKYTLEKTVPQPEDTFLEVAAGTCLCGRAFAPAVKTAVCLDVTEAMLQVGQQQAEKQGLSNMVFVKGSAQELPFLNNSFHIVFSRLAFHHFPKAERPFAEMVRVLRPGGKLVMVDMEAAPQSLRSQQDAIEAMRDPSHVKNLSMEEMQALFLSHGLQIKNLDVTLMKQNLQNWMDLTATPNPVRKKIAALMQAELQGGPKTGFAPFQTPEGICFYQKWVYISAQKPLE